MVPGSRSLRRAQSSRGLPYFLYKFSISHLKNAVTEYEEEDEYEYEIMQCSSSSSVFNAQTN